MINGRLLGIDWGEKRIGVAISGGEGSSQALPLSVVPNTPEGAQGIADVCKEEKITKIIVGLPLTARGKPTEKTQRAQAFGEMLQEKTGLPIERMDERLSTKAAEKIFEKKSSMDVDDLAAQYILQSYIDQHA